MINVKGLTISFQQPVLAFSNWPTDFKLFDGTIVENQTGSFSIPYGIYECYYSLTFDYFVLTQNNQWAIALSDVKHRCGEGFLNNEIVVKNSRGEKIRFGTEFTIQHLQQQLLSGILSNEKIVEYDEYAEKHGLESYKKLLRK